LVERRTDQRWGSWRRWLLLPGASSICALDWPHAEVCKGADGSTVLQQNSVAFAGAHVYAFRIGRVQGNGSACQRVCPRCSWIEVKRFHQGDPAPSAIIGSPHATVGGGSIDA